MSDRDLITSAAAWGLGSALLALVFPLVRVVQAAWMPPHSRIVAAVYAVSSVVLAATLASACFRLRKNKLCAGLDALRRHFKVQAILLLLFVVPFAIGVGVLLEQTVE